MKRFAGMLLVMVLLFSFSVALARKVECPAGGFSVSLPDHFVEEPASAPDLCFYWHGNKLTVQAYVSYQGEIALSDLFVVLTGNETEDRLVRINGMDMRTIRSDDGSTVSVTYTWMDRGNSVTMEFTYASGDSSVQKTVSSIINSIRFDAGH